MTHDEPSLLYSTDLPPDEAYMKEGGMPRDVRLNSQKEIDRTMETDRKPIKNAWFFCRDKNPGIFAEYLWVLRNGTSAGRMPGFSVRFGQEKRAFHID